MITQFFKAKYFISQEYQICTLLKLISFFWFVSKIWSYKTWVSDRVYPVIPPFEYLGIVPNSIHMGLYICSLALLLMIFFLPKNLLLLSSFFLVELLSCALDTVRWQPWEYMYLCFTLLFIINFKKPINTIFLLHIFLVSIYLFSGIHKVNRDFLYNVWMNMFLIDYLNLSVATIIKYKLFFIGLLLPLLEISFAVLLFVLKNKRPISLLLMGMHLCILLFLGPLGLAYNSIVWFWNVAMIFILYWLYRKPIEPFGTRIIFKNVYWVILWYIMPIFSFYGYWYQYFSFNLYSGKADQVYFCVPNSEKELLPYADEENSICPEFSLINLQNWAMAELKSAPIPEKEINEKIKVYMERKFKKENIKVMILNSKNSIIKNK